MPSSAPDRLLTCADDALRCLGAQAKASRPNPAAQLTSDLTEPERGHSAGLMRVNHVGEVCAQALYSAQAAFARSSAVATELKNSAREEQDHLSWTQTRLNELKARPSLLNPLWYAGSFAMGALAARVGDGISLGFVAETERQVAQHLNGHLDALPEADARSAAIVAQMKSDEEQHGAQAQSLGAAPLPPLAAKAMRGFAKVMTTVAYRI